MELDKKILHAIISSIQSTRADELTCGECYERLHEFADLELNGKSPQEALPLVKDHLERCDNCREEYEALLEILRTFF